MSSQRQETGSGAVAIQSGGNTTIHHGIDATQMREIIKALAEQLLIPGYVQMAKEVVEARLVEFEARVLARFATDKATSPDAFADPDFQAVVTQAQRAHARSGDAEVRDVLVDLIARRSAQRDRSRLSLTLNQAIGKSAELTHEEFAALSFVYVLHGVGFPVNNLQDLGATLRKYVSPFVGGFTHGSSVFGYLESQGCLTISGLTSFHFTRLLAHNYGGVLSNGFSQEDLTRVLGAEHEKRFRDVGLIVPCFHDSTRLQVNALRKNIYDEIVAKNGLVDCNAAGLWNLFNASVWSDATI